MEDGDPIDCTRMGIGGKAIPSLVNKITNIEGDAEFVLLVRQVESARIVRKLKEESNPFFCRESNLAQNLPSLFLTLKPLFPLQL